MQILTPLGTNHQPDFIGLPSKHVLNSCSVTRLLPSAHLEVICFLIKWLAGKPTNPFQSINTIFQKTWCGYLSLKCEQHWNQAKSQPKSRLKVLADHQCVPHRSSYGHYLVTHNFGLTDGELSCSPINFIHNWRCRWEGYKWPTYTKNHRSGVLNKRLFTKGSMENSNEVEPRPSSWSEIIPSSKTLFS